VWALAGDAAIFNTGPVMETIVQIKKPEDGLPPPDLVPRGATLVATVVGANDDKFLYSLPTSSPQQVLFLNADITGETATRDTV
jgi:hypothetical protein